MSCCPQCGKPAEEGLFKLYCPTKGCANYSAPAAVAVPTVVPGSGREWWLNNKVEQCPPYSKVLIHSRNYPDLVFFCRSTGHGYCRWADGTSGKNHEGLYPLDVLLKLAGSHYEGSPLFNAIIDLVSG